MIDIDLILPIYNESQNILNLIPKLKKYKLQFQNTFLL